MSVSDLKMMLRPCMRDMKYAFFGRTCCRIMALTPIELSLHANKRSCRMKVRNLVGGRQDVFGS